MLRTVGANVRTARTAAATVAYLIRAVYAELTSRAEISLSACAIDTPVTAITYVILCTVGTFFHTVKAYFGTVLASATAGAYVYAVSAGAAVRAPAVTSDAIDTKSAVNA